MKYIKRLFFNRLLPFIVSFIVFLSSFVLITFAQSTDPNVIDIPWSMLVPNVFRLNENWSINDDGTGNYGTTLLNLGHGAVAQWQNSTDTSDLSFSSTTTFQSSSNSYGLDNRLIYYSAKLFSPYFLEAGNYSISVPIGLSSSQVDRLDISGTVIVNVSNLIDNANGTWITNWYNNVQVPIVNGGFTLNYKVSVPHDITITHIRIGFVTQGTNLQSQGFRLYIREGFTLRYSPHYVLPDFSSSNEIFNDIKSAYDDSHASAGVESYEAYLDSFNEDDSIFISMVKTTAIFHAFFDEGTLFSNILIYSTIIGLCGYCLGVSFGPFLYNIGHSFSRYFRR